MLAGLLRAVCDDEGVDISHSDIIRLAEDEEKFMQERMRISSDNGNTYSHEDLLCVRVIGIDSVG